MKEYRIKKRVTTNANGKSKEEFWIQIKKWWMWRDLMIEYIHAYSLYSYYLDHKVIIFQSYKPCKNYLENNIKKDPTINYLGCPIMPLFNDKNELVYLNLNTNHCPDPDLYPFDFSDDLEQLKRRIAEKTTTTTESVVKEKQ